MNYSGQIFPEHTVGYFRVASASGRQPIHPVAVGEFLIGSGAQCHLRFGDDDVPEVHSTLQVERDTVYMTCHVEAPQLLLNGQSERECRLSDGDMIELGGHRMLFRLAAEASRITLDEEGFSTEVMEGPLEGLVDQIDEQIQLVEELSQSPDQAVIELLRASELASLESDNRPSADSSYEMREVRKLIQSQYEASRIRLESLTEVLDNVVRQQKLIADTLEVLSDRIQSADGVGGYPQRRASA